MDGRTSNRRLVVALGVVVTALWVAAGAAWVNAVQARASERQPAAVAAPRYAPPTVEVAPGVDVNQAEAAAYIGRIVNDPRGWRTDLSAFTVRIVPPGTREANGFGHLIGRAFREENLAIVTADAWTQVGKQFAAVGGTLDDQRTWIVLHELGHLLGHDHETCPGSGPAPIMRDVSYKIGDCDLSVWPNP